MEDIKQTLSQLLNFTDAEGNVIMVGNFTLAQVIGFVIAIIIAIIVIKAIKGIIKIIVLGVLVLLLALHFNITSPETVKGWINKGKEVIEENVDTEAIKTKVKDKVKEKVVDELKDLDTEEIKNKVIDELQSDTNKNQ